MMILHCHKGQKQMKQKGTQMISYQELKRRKRELDYQKRLLELQKKYPSAPAGSAASIQRKAAAICEDERQLLLDQERAADFMSTYDISSEVCIGREAELLSMNHFFASGYRVVTLTGIGGIGKSVLAKEYSRRYKDHYEHIIMIPGVPSLQRNFQDDSFLHFPDPPYSVKLYSSRRQYARKKLDALRRMLARKNCLVILDDIAGNEPFLREILSQPGHFLITSRLSAAELPLPEGLHLHADGRPEGPETEAVWKEIRLSGIPENACHDFYAVQSKKPGCSIEDAGSSFSREEYDRFLSFSAGTGFHPLSMQLYLTAEQMQSAARSYQAPAVTVKDDAARKDETISAFQKELLKRMNASDRKILLWLAFMSETGVEQTWFSFFAGILEKDITRLADRSLILCSRNCPGNPGESAHILLHPVVRQSVLQNNDLRIQKQREFLLKFSADLADAWNEDRETNRKKEASVLQVLKVFLPTVPWMAETFDKLITFLWITEYYSEAEQYALQLYQAVKDYYGVPHQMTGFAALRTAAVYYNSRSYAKASRWYRLASENLTACTPFNRNYHNVLVSALYKNARELQISGEVEEAWKALEQGIRISEACAKEQATPFWLKELVYFYRRAAVLLLPGDPDQAQLYYRKMHAAVEDMKTAGCTEPITDADIGETDALFLESSGRLPEAISVLRKNVEIYELYRGEYHEDTIHAREQLSDMLFIAGSDEEAKNIITAILRILREHYPREKAWIRRLQAKL